MPTIKTLRHRYALTGIHQDVDLLLAESIQKNTAFLDTHPEYRLRASEYLRFHWFLRRYRRGYSVAVVVGHKEFFGLDFLVNQHTLIPRPETELMVEEALRTMNNNESRIMNRGVILIDVGTGSGCIPIAIMKTLKYQNIKTIAIDISRSALRVAKKNAEFHHVKIGFLSGSLLEPILKNPSLCPSPIRGGVRGGVVITANLPYLTREQVASEPSVRREPLTALVSEEGGLTHYRELFTQVQQIKPVIPTTILCEIDPSQSERMRTMVKSSFPAALVEIKKDLAGRDRLAVITVSP
ncbi:MAG: peptide chain release factor N(5)-glutamine methyltransferase [Candidatus Magasanikbacteria bacterium]|nr:peptide chain release factor N(5)-glutamine methyltransferase [Candidatus Magasanikbacteria bacterium]